MGQFAVVLAVKLASLGRGQSRRGVHDGEVGLDRMATFQILLEHECFLPYLHQLLM